MLAELNSYDWQEAFAYASPEPVIAGRKMDCSPFTRDDVAAIHGIEEGENDGPSWIIYGLLDDGRWFFLEAGCDYTGWD